MSKYIDIMKILRDNKSQFTLEVKIGNKSLCKYRCHVYRNGIVLNNNGNVNIFKLYEYESNRYAGIRFTNELGLFKSSSSAYELKYDNIKIVINNDYEFYLTDERKETTKKANNEDIIGSFYVGTCKLVIVETDEDDDCKGCFFEGMSACEELSDYIPPCSNRARVDKKSVIFKKA